MHSHTSRSIVPQHNQRNAGSAAAEFALALPILLIFLIGGADYGVMAYQEAVLVAAARAGAEYASAYARSSTTYTLPTSFTGYVALPPGATITASQACSCSGTLGTAPTTTSCTWGSYSCSSGTEMDYVLVTAQINPYQPILGSNTGITSLFIPSKLAATVYIRVQ